MTEVTGTRGLRQVGPTSTAGIDRRTAIGAAGLVMIFGVGLVGCSVGPDHVAPDLTSRLGDAWVEAPSPGEAEESSAAGSASESALDEWWLAFEDPALEALVQHALAGNLDLAAARERILQARARRGISNAERLPNLDAEGRYTAFDSEPESRALDGPSGGAEGDIYSLGVVAGWEIDLWGRVGRLVEAADADIAAAIEDERAARIALAAEVAREVILIRSLDARLDVVSRTIELDAEALDIATARRQAGLTSELDQLRAERNLQRTRALVPDLTAERKAAEHRVATLLGQRPELNLVARVDGLPAAPAIPDLGIPADLLVRRPDVRRAERNLAAATARIGAAVAERYPRVTLSGSFALSGDELSDIVNGDAATGRIGPSITLPIFSGGRIAANIDLAESQARERLAQLELTVLDAVREVETALARRQRSTERIARLESAARSAADAERLATALYAAGRTDFINVLDAQVELLGIENDLVLARREALTQSVDLFAALGGGWTPPSSPALVAATEGSSVAGSPPGAVR